MAAGNKEQKRRARRSRGLAVLALMVLLAVGIVLFAPRLVPQDVLASRAADALAAATGAEVVVGAAQLTLIGGPGLQLRAARIRDAAQLDVELEQLDVSLAVWPLLLRQVVIDGLRARGPSAKAVWQGQPVEISGFAVRAHRLHLHVPLNAGDPEAATPGPRIPADLSGSFTVSAAKVAWSTILLEQMQAAGGFEQRVLTVRSLTAGCGGGQLSVAATLDFAAAPGGVLAGELTMDDVDADALAGAWLPDVAAQLDARLTGRAQAQCRLLDAATALASLEVDGEVSAGEGLLRAGPWLGDVAPYLGDRQDLVDIRISGLRHVFGVADGRYLVDTLTIDGPDTEWSLQGTVALDGRLNLAVHLRLPSGFTPRMGSMTYFAEALRDEQGRVNLDLRLNGPIAEPAVALDVPAMAARLKRPSSSSPGASATPQKGLGAILDKWKVK